jgi:hypothetical protein
MKAKNQGMHLE